MSKDITTVYGDFLNYFSREFPLLRSKFPTPIPFNFLNSPYGVQRPEAVTEDEYEDFKRIEFNWLLENDVIQSSSDRPIFLLVKQGHTSLSAEEIESIEAIDNKTTRVVTKEKNGLSFTFDINESIGSVKNRLDID